MTKCNNCSTDDTYKFVCNSCWDSHPCNIDICEICNEKHDSAGKCPECGRTVCFFNESCFEECELHGKMCIDCYD